MSSQRVSAAQLPRSLTVAAWSVVALLAVIVAILAGRPGTGWVPQAFGQQTMLGARGIYAFPVQLSSKSYGVCMLDVDAGTLWLYEYVPTKHSLRLAAARSWIFDRYLEEYSVDGLTPADVGNLVRKQRSQRQRLETSGADAALEPWNGSEAPTNVPPVP